MPPRRLPVGAATGPRLVGLLAGVLLVAALLITGRVQSWAPPRPPAPPERTDAAAAPYRIGSSFRCPLARPVLAMSSGHSYPPGHPARPLREATAVACYQTVEQASAAGYLQAPLPAGTDELFGVYLIPTGSPLRRQCQRAADRLGFAVPCPRLLPTSLPGSVPPTLCEEPYPCGRGLPFVLDWGGFAVPPGYVGVDGQPMGRLVIAATRGTPRFPLACTGERMVATVKVHGVPARLLHCPSNAPVYSLHGGGVLLRWSQRDLVVMVSLQGRTPLNDRLVQKLAAHFQFMPPALS
jgi:hypothetical protein